MSLLTYLKKQTRKGKTAGKGKQAGAQEAEAAAMPLSAGRINLRLAVTEKSIGLQSTANTVMFRVRPEATKGQIALAVEERYKIRPEKVRTAVMAPKQRRRGKTEGWTAVWKKAYVTLPEGKNIEL